jgi:hypothetical protein
LFPRYLDQQLAFGLREGEGARHQPAAFAS